MAERTKESDISREHPPMERYYERTDTSRAHFEEACNYMPGGNTRGVLYYDPYPVYLTDGDGAYVTDVDGNEYLDFLNNYTTLIHGHADRDSAEAAIESIRRSSAPGGPTTVEIDWARHLVERAPALDQIRFTNSGTEATMNAIRAARAYTGNDIIAKCEGAYHGTHDDVQLSVHPPTHLAGPDDDPDPVPDSAGVPSSKHDEVIVFPFNDAAATIETLERHQSELAGVILAPYMGSGVVPIEQEYIEELAAWTDTHDIPLILDEVISFRVAYGGAHESLGIQPDLITYGKLIGGGFAVGAFGGRTELMAPFDPRGGSDIVHSGTFNANPVTAAAGLSTLNKFDESSVESLNALTADLAAASRDVIEDRGLTLQVTQVGSLFNFYLTPHPVTNYREKTGSEALQQELFHELLAEGVRLAPKLMGCLSTPMDDTDVEHFVDALDSALARMDSSFNTHAPELIA